MNKRIIHFHPNGVMADIFIEPLVDFERRSGYESSVITSINTAKSGCAVIRYDLTLANLFFLPLSFIKICCLLLKNRPYLVISHNSRSSPIPLFAAWLLRIPVRVYFNHGLPFLGYRGLLRIILMTIEKFNSHFSSRIITVSSDMSDNLKLLCKRSNVSLIAFGSASGIDFSKFNRENFLRSSFRNINQIDDSNFVAAYIGRPEKRKGFHVVLKLWANYFSSKTYKLVLCGPSELKVQECLGLIPANVLPMGFVTNIPEVLSAVDCLILPSYHEGLSYVVLEAMASGCIVIANDIPGVRDLVEHEVTGFLVSSNSEEDYARLVRFLASSSVNYLEKIRLNAFKKSKKFSREVFLRAYELFLLETFRNDKNRS